MKMKKNKAAKIKINNIINIIPAKTITETSMLLLAAANSVANMVNYKKRVSRSFPKMCQFSKIYKIWLLLHK